MKAPDKIYLHPDDRHWWQEGNKTDDRFVEYIRKDALIEWLAEGYNWVRNPLIYVDALIAKLNEM